MNEHLWTVSLELPECDGADPIQAVRDFQRQAEQENLFVYVVVNDSTGERFHVDMADDVVTVIDEQGRPA